MYVVSCVFSLSPRLLLFIPEFFDSGIVLIYWKKLSYKVAMDLCHFNNALNLCNSSFIRVKTNQNHMVETVLCILA